MNGERGDVSEADVRRLVELAAQVFGRYVPLPAASDLADLGDWLMSALRVRADLAGPVAAALGATRGLDADVALARLSHEDPGAFEAVRTIVAGAYLMHPDVRAALGYPGQVPRLARPDVDDYAAMLEAVVERGERYRPAPD